MKTRLFIAVVLCKGVALRTNSCCRGGPRGLSIDATPQPLYQNISSPSTILGMDIVWITALSMSYTVYMYKIILLKRREPLLVGYHLLGNLRGEVELVRSSLLFKRSIPSVLQINLSTKIFSFKSQFWITLLMPFFMTVFWMPFLMYSYLFIDTVSSEMIKFFLTKYLSQRGCALCVDLCSDKDSPSLLNNILGRDHL